MRDARAAFDDLDALRRRLLVTRADQPAALRWFHDTQTKGFRSVASRPAGHLSPSSTATCVMSLVETAQWSEQAWYDTGGTLARALLLEAKPTTGLPENNPYTDAFILEAVSAMLYDHSTSPARPRPEFGDFFLSQDVQDRITDIQNRLVDALLTGSVTIGDYPPSAYLTQLAVRALKRSGVDPDRLPQSVERWAWSEIHRQLALGGAQLKSFDPFQLAYATIVVAQLGRPGRATPDERRLIDASLAAFFNAQLPDGSWPRSAPIFDIPKRGSSYCYEYELLAQLLQVASLQDRLLSYMTHFTVAYDGLLRTAYQLPSDVLAWSSGHRPQLTEPESWATASAYHFAHALERLVAEALRRAVFSYVRQPYTPPTRPRTGFHEFAPGLLDSTTLVNGEPVTVQDTLFTSFVEPIAVNAGRLFAGASLPSEVPTTAILFGPPGTSKTEMSKVISEYLRWPRLTLDPSHFVRNGMDMVSAEANLMFSMLESLDRVVVLLDEIDELVRERAGSSEFLSRFLTTTMLPKLASISGGKRIVFLVATNHIEQFDIAISRPGRFDLILQVMPPTADEKYTHWDALGGLKRHIRDDTSRTGQLEALTFAETARLAQRLADAPGTRKNLVLAELDAASRTCTLMTPVDRMADPNRTWSMACSEQTNRNRIPGRPSASEAGGAQPDASGPGGGAESRKRRR